MENYHVLSTRSINSVEWVRVAYFVERNPSIVESHPDPRIQLIEQWHTYSCLLSQARYEAERKLYERVWPNYCHECGGMGGFWTEYDPSPAGISLSPGTMRDFDPCECVSPQGITRARCPRCSARFVHFADTGWMDEMSNQWPHDNPPNRDDLLDAWVEHIVCDQVPCPVCGWDWGNGKHDALPEPPECGCWALPNNPDYPGGTQ